MTTTAPTHTIEGYPVRSNPSPRWIDNCASEYEVLITNRWQRLYRTLDRTHYFTRTRSYANKFFPAPALIAVA
jgi:hypothetical protein